MAVKKKKKIPWKCSSLESSEDKQCDVWKGNRKASGWWGLELVFCLLCLPPAHRRAEPQHPTKPASGFTPYLPLSLQSGHIHGPVTFVPTFFSWCNFFFFFLIHSPSNPKLCRKKHFSPITFVSQRN